MLVRADDHDAEAMITRDLWRNHRLIAPASSSKKWWDAALHLLMMYGCFYTPMQAAFRIHHAPAHLALDYFFDLLFWLDIVVTFRTVRRSHAPLTPSPVPTARAAACAHAACAAGRPNGRVGGPQMPPSLSTSTMS